MRDIVSKWVISGVPAQRGILSVHIGIFLIKWQTNWKIRSETINVRIHFLCTEPTYQGQTRFYEFGNNVEPVTLVLIETKRGLQKLHINDHRAIH